MQFIGSWACLMVYHLISHCKYGQFYGPHQSEFMRANWFQYLLIQIYDQVVTFMSLFQPLKEGLSLLSSSVDTPEGRLQDHFGRITICIIWLKFTKFCSDNLIIEK